MVSARNRSQEPERIGRASQLAEDLRVIVRALPRGEDLFYVAQAGSMTRTLNVTRRSGRVIGATQRTKLNGMSDRGWISEQEPNESARVFGILPAGYDAIRALETTRKAS